MSLVSAFTNPASTLAVALTTEHELGVRDVTSTFDTRDVGTLMNER